MTKERNHFLADLIGKGKANDLRNSLRNKKSLLDMAGVERKDMTSKENDVLVVADAVATKIATALEEAGVVQAAVSSDEAAEISEAEDVTKIVAQAAMEAVDEIETSEPEESEEDTVKSVVKMLGDALAQNLTDVGAIAEGQTEIVGVIKDMVQKVDSSNERLDALEKKVNSRPRQASKDKDNVFSDEKVEAEAKKSLDEAVTFLDIRLKE